MPRSEAQDAPEDVTGTPSMIFTIFTWIVETHRDLSTTQSYIEETHHRL